jgi:hypothetical protein
MAYYTMTVADSVPASTSITGTATLTNTSNWLTGVGTAFLTEFQKFDFVLDTANGLLYEVEFVRSNTLIYLKTPATATTSSVKAVNMRPNINYISLLSDGTSSTKDGETLPQSIAVTIGSQDARVETKPVYVDPDGATVTVITQTTP